MSAPSLLLSVVRVVSFGIRWFGRNCTFYGDAQAVEMVCPADRQSMIRSDYRPLRAKI